MESRRHLQEDREERLESIEWGKIQIKYSRLKNEVRYV
jgi:hypothetical protein